MPESMKILIITSNGYGHLNVGLGMADMLTKRGHQVNFLLRQCWAKNIESRGYGARIVEEEELQDKNMDQAKPLMDYLEELIPKLKKPTIEQLSWMSGEDNILIDDTTKINTSLTKLLTQETFDLIIVATLLALPCAETCGIPWVYFHTPSPHILYGEQITPPFSGYPLNTDKETCDKFWQRYYEARKYTQDEWNSYLAKNGVGPINTGYFARESPYLNIYAYPEELDYRDVASLPANYFRMDNALREDDGTPTDIPKEFLEKPGKLIYVALGSWFSGIVEVMERLVSILSKSPHKFILSKGPNHEKYSLGENMWGQRFVNQLQILPMVDLVIAHGGNNTTVECAHFGKPMIVLPCFVDQHDNAQRIHEKGLGVKFNPFEIEEKSLLETIEKMLADDQLKARMAKVSESVRNSKTRDELVDLLEKIVATKKSPVEVNGSNHTNGTSVKTNGTVNGSSKTNGETNGRAEKIATNGDGKSVNGDGKSANGDGKSVNGVGKQTGKADGVDGIPMIIEEANGDAKVNGSKIVETFVESVVEKVMEKTNGSSNLENGSNGQ